MHHLMALFWKVPFLAAVICCVTCLPWYPVYNEETQQHLTESKRAQRYCGEILDKVLSAVCNNKYNGPFRDYRKRSTDSNKAIEELEAYDDQFYKTMIFPMISSKAMKRGVHTECCLRPCTPAVLQTYCAA